MATPERPVEDEEDAKREEQRDKADPPQQERRQERRSGVKLFELKPTAASGGISLRGSSQASLHTKAFTSDGTAGFVGSLNFDPRSVSLNTEMGVLFAVPELVAEMDRIFAEEISPAMSYRVTLDGDDGLIWSATESGVAVQLTQEPEASLGRRILARVVGWLPLESQL